MSPILRERQPLIAFFKTALGRAALEASTFMFGTTTIVTGISLSDRERYPVKETIRGGDPDKPYEDTGRPEHFDTERQVPLYHPVKEGDPAGAIYLHAFNLADHAICSILYRQPSHPRYGKQELAAVPLRVAINNELQNVGGDYPRWQIGQGQKLQAWIGGDSFDKRNRAYGDATVSWTPPPAKAR